MTIYFSSRRDWKAGQHISDELKSWSKSTKSGDLRVLEHMYEASGFRIEFPRDFVLAGGSLSAEITIQDAKPNSSALFKDTDGSTGRDMAIAHSYTGTDRVNKIAIETKGDGIKAINGPGKGVEDALISNNGNRAINSEFITNEKGIIFTTNDRAGIITPENALGLTVNNFLPKGSIDADKNDYADFAEGVGPEWSKMPYPDEAVLLEPDLQLEPEPEGLLSFKLAFTGSNKDIYSLSDRSMISTGDLDQRKVTVYAEAQSDDVEIGSVRISVDGIGSRLENFAPYALFGDNGKGDLFGGKALGQGAYEIKVTVYAGKNGTGKVLEKSTAEFTVVDEAKASKFAIYRSAASSRDDLSLVSSDEDSSDAFVSAFAAPEPKQAPLIVAGSFISFADFADIGDWGGSNAHANPATPENLIEYVGTDSSDSFWQSIDELG